MNQAVLALVEQSPPGPVDAFDRAVRDQVVAFRGREIDRAGGFLLLFPTVDDAVGFAGSLHAVLGAGPARAQIGLHVGDVALRENPPADVARGAKPVEVEGVAKPVAARVMSVATPGQTLLTAAAQAALTPSRAHRVESHGHWRLKGVDEPLELFELGPPGAVFAPPSDSEKVHRVVRATDGTWRPRREVPHGLPAERDPFVGRQEDLRDLSRRFDDGGRLVTLLGLGGVGKTRLALRYAWTWLGDWPGGAWFCDLSEARDLDGVVTAVGRALGVPVGKEDPVAQLGHAMGGRGRCLVVLDNFEQVAALAPDTLGRWLDFATDASFLVTTREVLGLPGEHVLALSTLSEEDGAALFAVRGSAARRGWTIEDADRAVVARLVRLLDGLPLAIELAASRLSLFTPAKLVERLNDRFRLLASSGGRRDRQATLRATLDWSWDLLQPWERAALAQLSVFEGGFDLEAAEAVLDLSGWPAAPWAPDVLGSLVGKSLVRTAADERFDLLVTVQEYAASRLEALEPAAVEAAQARHFGHYARLGSPERMRAFRGRGGGVTRARVRLDLDNVLAAVRRAARRGVAEAAGPLLDVASGLLSLTGPFGPMMELADLVASIEGAPERVLARAAFIGAQARRTLADFAGAEARLVVALERAERLGELALAADILQALSEIHIATGRGALGRSEMDRAVEVARRSGSDRALGGTLGDRGTIHFQAGRLDDAEGDLRESMALAERIGDGPMIARDVANLGLVAFQRGDLASAEDGLRRAIALAEAEGDHRSGAHNLANLGIVQSRRGRDAEARETLMRALRAVRELGLKRLEGGILNNLSTLALDEGRVAEGEELLRGAIEVAVRIGDRWWEGPRRMNLGNILRMRELPVEAHAEFARAMAAAEAAANVVSRMSVHHMWGLLFADGDRLDDARQHLEAAAELAPKLADAGQRAKILASLGLVRARLGDPTAGRALVDEAFALLPSTEDPKRCDVWIALARLEGHCGDGAAVRAALDEARRVLLPGNYQVEHDLTLARRALLGEP